MSYFDDDYAKGAFGGYRVTRRSFKIGVTDLQIGRGWRRKDRDSGDADVISVSIGGKARSEDEVAIIGGAKRSNDFYFNLNADSSEETAREWSESKQFHGLAGDVEDEETPERKLLHHICDQFDESPPTATLFWYGSDAEIGVEEAWSIECTISKEAFDQLFQDILAGNANTISARMRWVGLVSDIHAPPAEAIAWGLFEIDAKSHSPMPLYGHVEFLNWVLTPSQTAFSGNGDRHGDQ